MSLNPSNDRGWTPAPGEVLSVAGLISLVRSLTENTFHDIWLEGEISDLRIPASGHAYFNLSDKSAQLRAVCFRSALRLLDHPPKNGMAVLARGRLSVYEQRGDLQLIVEHMAPVGVGLMRLQLEALKKKLQIEGLFAEERKRPLPAMPRAIAVVTSPTGAVVRDILHVLKRRAPWLDVYVCPARVQGEKAPEEIVRALRDAQEPEQVELVIVGRGGGAGEDLSAFNDERVVRAVAGCRVPVISAVGHETDFTLTDFAADKRAPTPSAAAELAAREGSHWQALLARSELSLASSMRALTAGLRETLGSLDPHRFEPGRVIERRRLRVDRLMESASGALSRNFAGLKERFHEARRELGSISPELRLAGSSSRLCALEARLHSSLERDFTSRKNKLALLGGSLDKLSPTAVLKRGYAVVVDGRGKVVTDAGTRSPGEEVEVSLARGALGCRIVRVDRD
jgi:exodeoxyribonuclease VII large subunit